MTMADNSLNRCIVVACLFLSGCWIEPQQADIKRIIEEQGFTNVSGIKPIFFGCDMHDAFRYSFTATSPNGHQITGYVCSSWFKAWTVRMN